MGNADVLAPHVLTPVTNAPGTDSMSRRCASRLMVLEFNRIDNQIRFGGAKVVR